MKKLICILYLEVGLIAQLNEISNLTQEAIHTMMQKSMITKNIFLIKNKSTNFQIHSQNYLQKSKTIRINFRMNVTLGCSFITLCSFLIYETNEPRMEFKLLLNTGHITTFTTTRQENNYYKRKQHDDTYDKRTVGNWIRKKEQKPKGIIFGSGQ